MDQLLRCPGLARERRRHAKAGGYAYGGLLERHMDVSELFAQTFRLRPAGFFVAARQQDEKFFPAVAADRVILADRGLHASRGFTKDGVAGEVTVVVIDAFKVIQVYHYHAHRGAFPLRARQLPAEDIED